VILDHIGQTYYQLGEKDRAIEYLEKAIALEPENEEYTTRLKEFRDGTAKVLKRQSGAKPSAPEGSAGGEPSKSPPAPKPPSGEPVATTPAIPR